MGKIIICGTAAFALATAVSVYPYERWSIHDRLIIFWVLIGLGVLLYVIAFYLWFKTKELPKTRLDLWDDFLESNKKKAEKLWINPTIQEYLDLYDNFSSGLKTAFIENHPDLSWFFRISYEHNEFEMARSYYKVSPNTTARLQKLIRTVLNSIRYFKSKRPPYTALDFRDFEQKDFKRYY